jgi:tetratricopeptide (TPR) repeat protein
MNRATGENRRPLPSTVQIANSDGERGPMRKQRRTVCDYNEMGVFFYGRGAYDLAISQFKLALMSALFPMPALHINLGAAYLGKKMYPEAEAELRRGLAIDPRSQNGHTLLGRLLRQTGRDVEALAEFERVCELDPETPEAKSAEEEVRCLKARVSHG